MSVMDRAGGVGHTLGMRAAAPAFVPGPARMGGIDRADAIVDIGGIGGADPATNGDGAGVNEPNKITDKEIDDDMSTAAPGVACCAGAGSRAEEGAHCGDLFRFGHAADRDLGICCGQTCSILRRHAGIDPSGG